MKKALLVRVLAVIVAVMFVATAGWAADPKATAKAAPAPEKKVEKAAEPIDLNTATKEQLMTLTGVGEVTAQQIIKNRPYAKKDQLKSKKILTDQGYDKIKDKIIAKQPQKKK